MKVTIVGTGYVGLVTGVCFAEFGYEVVCVDKCREIVERLSAGQATIFEPSLDDLLTRNLAAGRLHFSSNVGEASVRADIIIVAVGTPSRRDGAADLQHIFAAVDEIAKTMPPGAVVAIKSTVAVGTCAQVRERIRRLRPGVAFSVVCNPEFLRAGAAVADFMEPDRIVVGADAETGRSMMRQLYRPLANAGIPLVETSLENAEIIKYAANAFLAMKVTYINQIADLCEDVGGDILDVSRGVGLDKRIGPQFLNAGPGFGGSCFPKDTKAFAATGRKHGVPQRLIETVVDINIERKRALAARIVRLAKKVDGDTVAVLGIAFKSGTDDIREAPALDIVPLLQEAGLTVRAHDPEAMENGRHALAGVIWCETVLETVKGADLTIVMTEWPAYRALDLRLAAGLMKGKVLVDFRNIYRAADLQDTGLSYYPIGRPVLSPLTEPS